MKLKTEFTPLSGSRVHGAQHYIHNREISSILPFW